MIPYINQITVAKQSAAAASLASNSITINSGSAVIVGVEIDAGVDLSSWAVACTDGLSNTYTQIGSQLFSANNKRLFAFISYNSASGACVVTATVTGGTPRIAIGTMEAVGVYLGATIALDSGSPVNTTGTSTAPAGGSTTVTNANQLVITLASSVAAGTITCAVPTGYTSGPQILTGTSNSVLSMAYRLAATTENPAWTIVSAVWAAMNISILSANMPNVQYNASTGSDTLASGAGPGTAITGTAAATHANSTVNITDGVALGGVALDGSSVLLVQTSSGRQMSRIINITGTSGAWVVTTQDAYGVSDAADSWSIGGNLASTGGTHGTRFFTGDARAGWTATLNTADSISAVITGSGNGDNINGPITVQGASEGTVITQTSNANHFALGSSTLWTFQNLKGLNSNGTKTSAIFLAASTGAFKFVRCILGDTTSTSNLLNGAARSAGSPSFLFEDCEIVNCTGAGVSSSGSGTLVVTGTWIHGCAAGGINWAGTVAMGNKSIVAKNTGAGITLAAGSTGLQINDSTIDGNSTSGIDTSAITISLIFSWILNCEITGNGAFGIKCIQSQRNAIGAFIEDFNNFGSGGSVNTLGAVFGITQGSNDLAVDPGYVSTSGNNYGVGTNVQAKAFPVSTRNIGANQSATVNYGDIGAQHQSAAAGGGGGHIIGCM